MKTEQERIEQMDKMAQVMCGFCTEDKRCVLRYSAPCSEVKSQDCSYKGNAEMLICAGYGDVSEYKAEIEDLKAENETYCKQINQAYDTGYNDGYDSCQDDIKQAKIDVLNELKGRVRTSYVLDDFILGNVVFSKDIDELIEEIENNVQSKED